LAQKENYAARNYSVPVQRMQKPELQQNEKQTHHYRTDRIEKVLPVLPEASSASGDEVAISAVSVTLGRTRIG
jgi:hypothetical protein